MARRGKSAAAAIGVSVHTGWVVAVVASGTLDDPRVVLRRRFELLGQGERFLFHAAAEVPIARAEALVEDRRRRVDGAARDAVDAAVAAARDAGESVAALAAVGSARQLGELAQIVSSHAMIHAAEGAFYTRAILEAARARGLRAEAVAAKELDQRAMSAFGTDGAALRARMAAIGKIVGRPWSADEKSAALAAWIAVGPR
jgi:hypothetical protein